jgi:putative methionine-R-sulfoxide reductase with GAF domain
VPYVHDGKTLWVLDIDSDKLDDFNDIDRVHLEKIVEIVGTRRRR